MRTRPWSVPLSALVLVLVCIPAGPASAGVFDNTCVVANQPAATLLFPYFEVDFSNPGARTTLIAINRLWGGPPSLARVTLWTEWGLPTAAFTLYLKDSDVVTINLRDIFNTGLVPTTGPGADSFPGCNATIGGSVGITPLIMQYAHTGQKVLNFCFSSGSQGPNIATGYVTVDDAIRCPTGSGGGSQTPTDGAGYFSGASQIAGTNNQLWGDWFLVTPNENFATGFSAVSIPADSAHFGAGDYTFYGKYLGFAGTDKRRSLPSIYYHRFLIGGVFSGGTKALVWRDTRSTESAISCGSPANTCASAACQPDWLPLGEDELRFWDEDANSTVFNNSSYFDLAVQKVDLDDIPHPYSFGWVRYDLDTSGSVPAQAWVGFEANAEGRYSVGIEATPVNTSSSDNCQRDPTP